MIGEVRLSESRFYVYNFKQKRFVTNSNDSDNINKSIKNLEFEVMFGFYQNINIF